MNIIILGPAYPFRGGIADTNESLCRAINRQGHHASIITFTMLYPRIYFPGKTQYSNDKPPTGLNIIRKIHSINPFNWIAVARKINKLKPDLVLIRYWLPFLAPCLGSIARLLKKNIKIIALTDNIIPHEKRIGDIFLTKYFIKPCNAFITLSTTVRKELDSLTRKEKMYFPHPINDNLGEQIPKEKAREFLKLKAAGKYILFFGLVRKYKGLDLLLKAFGQEKIKNSDINLLIVGEFYDDPETYYSIIKEHNLQDKVIIENRFIASSEIKYYFSATDMVAQTYHTASQSGITQIAYHFNCPMLVTDVGGLSEIVPHNKVGYVVNKEPLAIAEAIHTFYTKDKLVTFETNIIEEKKKYSWDTFVEKMLEFYHTLK